MKPTRFLPAALWLMAATISFTLLDASAKYLSERVPVPVIVWVRYTVHCLFMIAAFAPRMGFDLVKTGRPFLHILRGLALLLTTACGLTALSQMPLAETLAIAFLSPLIVVIAAGPLLGEQPKPAIWFAVLLGFVGVLLIARPGGAVNGAGLFFALATALVYAAYQLLTRALSASEGQLTLLFYTALVGALGASCLVPFYWPQHMVDTRDAVLLCALALFGGGGHFLLIRAFSLAPASSLSPLMYVQLLWQTLAGWLVFDHLPDLYAVAGGLLIAGSGVAVVVSQKKTAGALAS